MNELFGDGFSRRWSGSSKIGAVEKKLSRPPPALSEQAGRPHAARNCARWWSGSDHRAFDVRYAPQSI